MKKSTLFLLAIIVGLFLFSPTFLVAQKKAKPTTKTAQKKSMKKPTVPRTPTVQTSKEDVWTTFNGDGFSVLAPNSNILKQTIQRESSKVTGPYVTRSYLALDKSNANFIFFTPNVFAMRFRPGLETSRLAVNNFLGGDYVSQESLCSRVTGVVCKTVKLKTTPDLATGIFIIDFKYVSNDKDVGLLRLFSTPKRTYILETVGRNGNLDADSGHKFIDSFKLK